MQNCVTIFKFQPKGVKLSASFPSLGRLPPEIPRPGNEMEEMDMKKCGNGEMWKSEKNERVSDFWGFCQTNMNVLAHFGADFRADSGVIVFSLVWG